MSPIVAPLNETLASIYGAYRLACGDTRGLNYFNATYEGFWRSFSAAIIIAPVFIIFLSIQYSYDAKNVNLMRFFYIHSIAYVTGWVAFPLLIFHLANLLKFNQGIICYIISYNWCSLLQNLIYLPFVIIVGAFQIQGGIINTIGIFLLGLVILYTWFISKVALNISGLFAVVIVMIDLFLIILINSTARILI